MTFWHINILTDDVEKTIDFLCATQGSTRDKWIVVDLEFSDDVMVIGDGGKLRAAFGRVGGIVYELMQPLDDKSYHAQQLKARGPGFHHSAYVCAENLDETVKNLIAAGGRIVWQAHPGNERCYYIESDGVVMEVINVCPIMPEE